MSTHETTLGLAEISELELIHSFPNLVVEDVGRLDVPMHHFLLLEVLIGVDELEGEVDCLLLWHFSQLLHKLLYEVFQ